ncbi:MAG: hypothetical protein ACI4WV_08930, partial [Eubacteriales bacterium]
MAVYPALPRLSLYTAGGEKAMNHTLCFLYYCLKWMPLTPREPLIYSAAHLRHIFSRLLLAEKL